MALVDVQRWDRNMRKNISQTPRNPDHFEVEAHGEFDSTGSVLQYSDLIAKELFCPTMRYCDTQQPTPRWGKHNDPSAQRPLV